MKYRIAVVVLALAVSGCRESVGPSTEQMPDLSNRTALAPDLSNKAALTSPGVLASSFGTSPSVEGRFMTVTAGGTGFYNIYVADEYWGRGLYTIGTGPNHPVTIQTGRTQNVLYGGAWASPGTTTTTIRSYTSQTDYVQCGSWYGSSLSVRDLCANATVEPLNGNGFRTTYTLSARDQLQVVQVVKANGTTHANSSVEVTTTVKNQGASAVSIGIRYLWDFMIAGDDGPAFFTKNPNSGPINSEVEYAAGSFSHYRVEDDGQCAGTNATFSVYGTNTGPAGVTPTPSGSTVIRHGAWPNTIGTAFDYAPAPWTFTGCDNSVLTYVGHTAGTAIVIQPGASYTFSHSIFSAPSDGSPPPFEEPPVALNVPPVANAGADQTVYRTSAAGASVTLNGTGSTDSDGSITSYDWTENGNSIGSGASPSVSLALGSHTITLTVTDDRGATHSDVVVVNVQNVAPVANAGADQSEFRTSAAGVDITLNGAASSDLDGTVNSYKWSENGVVIANGANPTLPFTLGTHTVNLEVTDNNGATHNDIVVITVKNVAPFARAGSNQALECVSGGALAHLDGSQSFDLDGTISYLWTTGATTATTSKIFALGTTTVGLTVTDNNGAQDSDQVDITVVDTRPPTISMAVSTVLWPPNHKMVKVASGISSSDACYTSASLTFGVTVTSNEPVNGLGDGNTSPDWQVIQNTNGTFDVYVRAERSGTGTGRIYTITATSGDASGNSTSASGTVTVPHSQGK